MIVYLSLEQVLLIHKKAMDHYGGAQGIRDKNLLEFAVMRPQMSVFGEDAYPTLFLKAAVLLHAIVQNHPFLDGNKRTGFGAMHIMLLRNGRDLSSSSAQEVRMCLDVATGNMSVEKVAQWIEMNSKEFRGSKHNP